MTVNIHQIPSDRMDSNSYLLEEEGHVVIIDGCAGPELIGEIEAHGWNADYLLLTHEHFDHIWYLQLLRETLHVPVVACRLCSERIQDVKSNLSNIADILYYYKTGIVRDGRSRPFTCEAADIMYEDDGLLRWREHTFRFQRLPGHSPASTIITMEGERGAEDSVVFSGDYLISGEEEILRLKGGSPEDYEAFARPALERIPAGTLICPGHGPVYRLGQEGDGAEAARTSCQPQQNEEIDREG